MKNNNVWKQQVSFYIRIYIQLNFNSNVWKNSTKLGFLWQKSWRISSLTMQIFFKRISWLLLAFLILCLARHLWAERPQLLLSSEGAGDPTQGNKKGVRQNMRSEIRSIVWSSSTTKDEIHRFEEEISSFKIQAIFQADDPTVVCLAAAVSNIPRGIPSMEFDESYSS